MLMKRIMFLCALLVLVSPLYAQVDTAKLQLGWNHGVIAGLTLTQVSYTDWATGGENSLAYNASIVGRSINEQEMTNWSTNYKFSFGQANLASKGIRKTDDVIDIATILAYKLNTYVNPYIAGSFKTQFVDGFEYTDTSKTVISSFMDPAYAQEGIGIGFIPIPQLKTRIGAALRETFTTKYSRWADDPKTPEIETSRIEGGLEWITDGEFKIDDNVFFKTHLETFAGFKTFDKWVILFDNLLTAKVSKYISAQLGVTLKYDEFVVKRTQIKEGLALGISYQLF